MVIFKSRPASTQTEERKRMCELLRAGGVDGTGGRTCTSILRFWRPLLYIKLRLQKSAGLSRLSAVIKNRRIRYGYASPAAAQTPATTQKPQGGFPFLTAFDSIIIPLLQGAFEGQFSLEVFLDSS